MAEQARRARIWPWGGILLLVMLWPLLLVASGTPSTPYYLKIATDICLYVILAVGLNVTLGFAGLLDLGFIAFYGIGAYTYAILSTGENGLPFWVILPIAIAAACFVRFLVGASCLRLRGDYLAIVTLGFGEIARTTFNNLTITGGTIGIAGIPAPDLGFAAIDPLRPSSHYATYYLCAVFVAFFVYAAIRIKYSRFGRAWIAIREDEVAAEAMGVDVFWTKVWAYVLGAVPAAVAGCLFAAKQRYVSAGSFTTLESILLVCIVVLGGLGSVRGAIVGAVALTLLPELPRLFPAVIETITQSYTDVVFYFPVLEEIPVVGRALSLPAEIMGDLERYRMLLFGLALVLVMLFRPQGLVGSTRRYAELHPALEGDARREDATLGEIRGGRERFR